MCVFVLLTLPSDFRFPFFSSELEWINFSEIESMNIPFPIFNLETDSLTSHFLGQKEFDSFYKNGPTPASSSCIFVFSNTQIVIFTTNKCEQMSIQYTVSGFKLTTFWTWVSSHNHLTRAPAIESIFCIAVQLHSVKIWTKKLFTDWPKCILTWKYILCL